ncbi:hypothetical protein M0802_009065 [Mischocyttarus mexicanus]|nr:hypothetical protein M0802_009065 [Mischocyttarus mexicanus]
MRFKISAQSSSGHKNLVTCVAWSSAEEIFSCGEDHLLICWYLESGNAHSTVITEFPLDFFPTSMQWHPRPNHLVTASKKQSLDVLLITTANGRFHLVSKNGRIEKSIEAHKGAATIGKWSTDGSVLLTAGEDGLIKVWSRSGMLRSIIVRGNSSILTSDWSPDCSKILYSQGGYLFFQSLNSNSKPYKWYAHEGLVLTVCWNHSHGFIISGGEDCRYKVWDSNGNQIYSSSSGDHPITAVNWCSSGDYFAIGSFNMIKLCDRTGWSHSLERINAGSVYSIAWSSDGTQVAMTCGSNVLTGHVIGKRLEWNNYEATLIKKEVLEIREVGNEVHEIIEISDRVVQLAFGFDHLIVITPVQCHIYSVTNWNTPAIFDLKSSSVSAVILANKHFLLVEWNFISLYNYQGRLLGVPKWKGMTQEPLYPPCISLCFDTLVIRDQKNEKLLHVLEISYNKPIVENQSHTHPQYITQLALNHIGSSSDRQLALIDITKDLYLISIRASGYGRACKIAAMAQNMMWAIDANVLAAMLDATLSVWFEFGKQPTIISVYNGMVNIRRGDGALVSSQFYTFFTSLHQLILHKKWKESLSLCRIAQNEILWTCMAIMATDNKELNVAEEAYAAIRRYDKVDYVRYIKNLPKMTERCAEMTLLSGDLLAAEGILLQNGLVEEAITLNIKVYNWNRALELAIRHKKQIEEVLNERKDYLKTLKKEETNSSYIAAMNNISSSLVQQVVVRS